MSLLYARRNPYLTMLWLAMLGSVLIFTFLSVAYVVSKGERPDFALPVAFWVSTGVLLASSLTLVWVNQAFRREQYDRYRKLLVLTFVLGLIFTVLQFVGWYELHAGGVFLQGALTGAYLYIFSGFHLLHVVGGVMALLIALLDAMRHREYVDAFIQSLNPIKKSRLLLITIYWHFVDVLWLYLFGFFLYHHYV